MTMRASQKQSRLPDHDDLLLDYAERLKNHLAERRAIHLHFSELEPTSRRGQNLKIALDFFTDLIRRYEGQSFLLKNKDLVVVFKGATVAQIDEVVLKLRYLFSDDPLVHDGNDAEDRIFCTWYALELDYAAFLIAIRRLHDDYVRRRELGNLPAARQPVPLRDLPEPIEPLTPNRLAQLEAALASFDLTSIVRRQMIAVMVPDAPPKPVFNELYCSIDELRYRLMPEVDLRSDRWLFQHLTCTLDRRLLKLLPEVERDITLPASLNMNVATLVDDAFLEFDRAMRSRQSKSFILELQPFDIIADMSAFNFARNFVHERGYKICLDGLSSLNLPLLPRDRLGADLVKIDWRVEDQKSMAADERKHLADAVRRTGATRVILAQCDDENAVEFGRSLGITLYQGRYIDTLLA